MNFDDPFNLYYWDDEDEEDFTLSEPDVMEVWEDDWRVDEWWDIYFIVGGV